MNVRDKNAGLRPAPLCLYHYMALLQSLLLRRKAECLQGTGQGVCRCRTESQFFQKSRGLREFLADSFSVKRN